MWQVLVLSDDSITVGKQIFEMKVNFGCRNTHNNPKIRVKSTFVADFLLKSFLSDFAKLGPRKAVFCFPAFKS